MEKEEMREGAKIRLLLRVRPVLGPALAGSVTPPHPPYVWA